MHIECLNIEIGHILFLFSWRMLFLLFELMNIVHELNFGIAVSMLFLRVWLIYVCSLIFDSLML